jgi:desulfoferrodoxin-like iron-binding protein
MRVIHFTNKKEQYMDTGKGNVSRRDFLQTAAIGAAVAAAGSVFRVGAKEEPAKPEPMKIFVCEVCGHIEFGNAPEMCPVCHAPKDKFALNNTIFSDTLSKFKANESSHMPVISLHKGPHLVSDIPCEEISVRVGKVMHPMEAGHHIKFIDWYMNDKFVTRFFPPLQLYPAVTIYRKPEASRVRAVHLCNLHGYWQNEASM